MRTTHSSSKRGFTLVELMIVVAIIGVLAALAIYGVRRYLASAKSSEARNTLGAILRGATAAFERESASSEIIQEGGNSSAASHNLCGSAVPVPAVVSAGTKYQPSTVAGADFETGTSTSGWRCLLFSMSKAMYYRYAYQQGAGYIGVPLGAPDPGAGGFEASAQGDVDGNGVFSTFAVTGTVNVATSQLLVGTQIFVNDEQE